MAIVNNDILIQLRPLPGIGKFEYGRNVVGKKQKPFADPFLPLPYRLITANVVRNVLLGTNSNYYTAWNTKWTGSDWSWYDDCLSALGSTSNTMKSAYNRAYAKCMEHLKSGSADLLALYLERYKAAEMVDQRFKQILDVANAAERKSLKGLARSLGTTPSDLRRRHRKSTGFLSTPSATFLEVSWGWMPLLQDAFNALYYLGDDFVPLKCFGAASYDVSTEFDTFNPSWGGTRNTYSIGAKVVVKVGLTCSISSVLQTEIARLGLTNPGASTWEVIPYSWLIDWFSSVGEVIEGWDDSLILRYERPFITRYARAWERQYFGEYVTQPANIRGTDYWRAHCVMNRETPSRLPGPMLVYHTDVFSPQRLAITTALLISRLKSFKSVSSTIL